MPVIRFWPAAISFNSPLFVVGQAEHSTTIDVPAGTTLLSAARQAGILVEAPCNGTGACGKCKIRLSTDSGRYVSSGGDCKHTLTASENADNIFLACQTVITGSGPVDLQPVTRSDNQNLQILNYGQRLEIELAPRISKLYQAAADNTLILADEWTIGEENGDTSAKAYGLVVDIGTTTLVAALIDFNTGQELASASALNPQSFHAQDVLSRIQFASEQDGLATLYHDIIKAINALIDSTTAQAGISAANIYEVIFSGNTCMLHLATGTDPASLGKYPYTPIIQGGNTLPASQLGLHTADFAEVYLPPIISAYVGADITAGILASRLPQLTGATLFVDIGTNGEMALAVDGHLTVTSTAAGPAFEGMNITHGMRAAPGALEKFHITTTGTIEIQTIGDITATGICGSGLLDIVGELVRNGLIAKNGKLIKPEAVRPTVQTLADSLSKQAGKSAFAITPQVYLSQKDIRQVQLAKGAVRAGIECLLAAKNISPEAVDRVFIAGSFGYHLNPDSLINIGMLPPAFLTKIQFLGNTAKTGGEALLLDQSTRTELAALIPDIEVLELANVTDFDRTFVDCLSF